MLLPRFLLAPPPRRRHTRPLNHLDRQIRPAPSTQAEADTTDGEITAKGITVADLARTLTLELS